ncbi:MAG: hypothetical protein DI589_16730 [Shinella sp.]|nr:MAG: hypothetical protein DI589_16730 [Shinella sp.]
MKEGWETLPVAAFARTSAGGTPAKSQKAFYEGGSIPWLLSGEVANANIVEAANYITDAGLKGSSAKLFPPGSVLVAMYGATAGEAGILKFQAATNQAVCAILPGDKHLPEYLYYYLLNAKPLLVAQAVGNAQPNISQAKIKALEIPLPPLEEQQRIVAILDEAFEGLDRARANAEANLQNARELFENYREARLNPSRTGWSLHKLEELVRIKHGFAFKSAYFVDHGDFAVLTPGNFYETGGFRDRGEKQRFYAGDFPQDFLLKKGDLLVAMTEQAPGLLGSCILVPSENQFLHNQRLGLVCPKEGVDWSAEYFAHAFNLKAFRKGLSDTCSGATVRHTSPGRILAQSIPYCGDANALAEVAVELTEREQDCRSLEALCEDKLKNIADLRQSLLQKAFAGELT